MSGEPAELAAELRALIPATAEVAEAVAEIIARVRTEGDAAVNDYTRTYDTDGADPEPLRVASADLSAAAQALAPDVRAALELAIANVRRVAEAQIEPDRTVEFAGHKVTIRERPVSRAAVYVPGGRAPYPSTAIMGVVTAAVAGVPEISACSPPRPDGELDPVVLGASAIAGASTVYRMGGAQAVAALAYGTESVDPADVIVGPGNVFVQEAKRQVYGQVGIDSFAGPSDLLVIASNRARADLVALDLLAQAEHGPGTLVIAVSPARELLGEVARRLQDTPDTGAVARLVQVPELESALALAEAFAPEHLELVGDQAQALADRVARAGCVFVGADAGTAFGDYIAGSNHVLPTDGDARFASMLAPAHFRRRFCEVRISDPEELARMGATIARAERFELHARSMEARVEPHGRSVEATVGDNG